MTSPSISLTIVREDDPPPWPDLADGPYIHLPGALLRVAVLEHGMASGAPSVALRIDLPDGPPVITETSVAAWIAVTAGMRAAFPAAFTGGPLQTPGNGRP